MPNPDTHTQPVPIQSPAIASIRVTCPHCGQFLDVVPIMAAQPAPAGNPPDQTAAPAVRLSRFAVNAIQRRLFPLASELERPAEPAMPSADTPPLAITRWPWGMLIMVIAGIVLIGVLLIWWGHPVAAPGAEARPAAAPSSTVLPATQTSGNLSAASAALLDTLTRYNRAETEAATGLSIEPLRPFMDPNGAFAQRRAAQLAERQRRNAPHQTILLRWAVGQVTVEGTTATVVTQETWSNQEVGAVAPEQATVRVTYTLRWDAAIGRWVIVETSQQPI